MWTMKKRRAEVQMERIGSCPESDGGKIKFTVWKRMKGTTKKGAEQE